MKNSGIEWIGEIPDDWEIQRIKDVFFIIGGNGFKDEFQGKTEGDYPFCKASDINGADIFLFSAQNYVDQDIVESQKYKLIPKNSILMAKIGEAMKKNHRKINSVICILDNNCQALCRKKDDNIKYLYYLLSQINMVWFDNGGTIPNISNQKLLNFDIPNILESQQKKIADYLDKKCAAVDRLIENQRAQIEKLKEYKQSVITEAVTKGLNPSAPMKDSGVGWIGDIPKGWEMLKMVQVCNLITDYVASGSFADLANNVTYLDYPDYALLVRTIDVSGKGHNAQCVYINKHAYDFLANSNLYGGELMFPNIGASVGDVYIVPKLYEKMSLAPNSIMVRAKYNNKFIYYYFSTTIGRFSLLDIAQSTAQPKFNKTDFRQLKIIFPEIEEQRQIVDYLDKKCAEIDKLIAIKQQKIETLTEYKKSLIYEYVTGKKQVG